MADHRHVASIVLIVLVDILDTTPDTAATAAQERSDAVVVLQENVPFLSFPYVCPEPVLVK
jgi:hypothetical protein